MRRIAITGLSRAGKSAFLTSLLWNIEYEMEYKEKAYRALTALNKYDEIVRERFSSSDFLSLFQSRASLTPFRLQDKIEDFKLGRFPEKTAECEGVFFKLQSNMPRFISALGSLLSSRFLCVDFPGERLEDALINRLESYESWSKHMYNLLTGEKYQRCRELSVPYRDLLKNKSAPSSEIIATYKELLYAFATEALPVSPSSFMLSPQGMRTKKINYQSAICGLSDDEQFVPLTDEWRDTDMYKQMEQHYHHYRSTLITPVFNLVNTADVLIILIDIADILRGGYQRYRASQDWLKVIPQLCQSSVLANPFHLGFGIKKVAFVATQSDRVLRKDIPHLESLLEDLTQEATLTIMSYGIPRDKIQRFYCSSCVSTVPVGDGKLAAYFGNEKKAYRPERIPKYWPSGTWKSQAPIPYPSPPPITGNIPPQSSNLNEILKFILD